MSTGSSHSATDLIQRAAVTSVELLFFFVSSKCIDGCCLKEEKKSGTYLAIFSNNLYNCKCAVQVNSVNQNNLCMHCDPKVDRKQGLGLHSICLGSVNLQVGMMQFSTSVH